MSMLSNINNKNKIIVIKYQRSKINESLVIGSRAEFWNYNIAPGSYSTNLIKPPPSWSYDAPGFQRP